MSKETDNLIESDNPIASLSHEQKIQFASSRYLGDIKSARPNATEAIRTSEFDIPTKEISTLSSDQG